MDLPTNQAKYGKVDRLLRKKDYKACRSRPISMGLRRFRLDLMEPSERYKARQLAETETIDLRDDLFG